jgi:hypothetical protein
MYKYFALLALLCASLICGAQQPVTQPIVNRMRKAELGFTIDYAPGNN